MLKDKCIIIYNVTEVNITKAMNLLPRLQWKHNIYRNLIGGMARGCEEAAPVNGTDNPDIVITTHT